MDPALPTAEVLMVEKGVGFSVARGGSFADA